MVKGYLIYDGLCGSCKRFKDIIVKLDTEKVFTPVSLHTKKAKQLLPDMPKKKLYSSFHIITPDKKVYSGADALQILLEYSPGKQLMKYVNKIPGINYIFRIGYALGKRLATRIPW